MRINYNKHLLALLFLTVSFASYAQLPNPDGSGTGDSDPPAPIDNKVIYLAVVAIAFAFLYFKKHRAVKA